MGLAVFDVTKRPAASIAGGEVEVIKRLTFDTDYPTGGYSFTAAMCGLTSIEYVDCPGVGGFVCEYDYAASKMKVMYGDNNNAADGPLIEVPAGLDAIDTLQARALVRGIV